MAHCKRNGIFRTTRNRKLFKHNKRFHPNSNLRGKIFPYDDATTVFLFVPSQAFGVRLSDKENEGSNWWVGIPFIIDRLCERIAFIEVDCIIKLGSKICNEFLFFLVVLLMKEHVLVTALAIFSAQIAAINS